MTAAALPSCATHRDQPASGTCARCGAFFCELDARQVEGLRYCATCAVHPEIDRLGAFQRACWGKRDLGAWMMGGFGALALLLTLAFAARFALRSDRGTWDNVFASLFVIVALLLPGVIGVLFALGFRSARWFVLAYPVLLELTLVSNGMGLASLLVTGLPMGFAFGLFFDARNKLFFQIPISEQQLRSLYDAHRNNRTARTGFALSFLGLVLFPVAPVALAVSIGGLLQVDPTARPPIGRKRQAIAGIALGALGTVLGAYLLFRLLGP
ncbi:MAG: hypothetical protein QM765_29525 [Myxococcales bacterium]